jgi:hypothetical protein
VALGKKKSPPLTVPSYHKPLLPSDKKWDPKRIRKEEKIYSLKRVSNLDREIISSIWHKLPRIIFERKKMSKHPLSLVGMVMTQIPTNYKYNKI